MAISTIKEAIDDMKKGRMVILVDDEDRENEGDLCMAAEHVTPEAINFMAKHGRGLICLSLSSDLADRLDLPLMVRDNRSRFGHGLHRFHRGETGRDHGDIGGGQGDDDPHGCGGRDHRGGPGEPRAYLPHPRAEGRRPRENRADGRLCGSRAARGTQKPQGSSARS